MKLEILVNRMCKYLAIFFFCSLFSCSRNTAADPGQFDPVPEKLLLIPVVEEISGIADSEFLPN
jgi:hypothetical protein